MKDVFVTPREGVKVREEHGKAHIPAGGANMMLTSYIRRRIADGDLLLGSEKEQAPGPAKTQNHKKG
jgi:hypothetical protein